MILYSHKDCGSCKILLGSSNFWLITVQELSDSFKIRFANWIYKLGRSYNLSRAF